MGQRSMSRRVVIVGASQTAAITNLIANDPTIQARLLGDNDVHAIRYPSEPAMDLSTCQYSPLLPAPRGLEQVAPGKFRAADPYSRRRR